MLFVQKFLNSGNSFIRKKILLIFLVGLIFRITLIIFFHQGYSIELVQFVEKFISNPSLDPWLSWSKQGSQVVSFPYGPSMLIYLAPFIWIGSLFGVNAAISYGIAQLVADILLLISLKKLNKIVFKSENEIRKLLIFWINPITIPIVYVLGLYDLIPILFLLLSFVYLLEKKFKASVTFYFFSVIGKSAIAITFPFFILYFIKRKQLFLSRTLLIVSYSIAVAASLMIIFFSDGIYLMLGKSTELDKLFAFSSQLGDKMFFWSPILVGILVFIFFRLRVMTFKVFISFILASFTIIIITSQSGSGWVIWSIPFMTLLYNNIKYDQTVLFLFLLLFGLQTIIYEFPEILDSINENIFLLLNKPKGLINSGLFLLGGTYVYILLTSQIKRSDPFGVNISPLSIGIAGDSSTGKDTIVDSLERVLSPNSTQHISGDDYHVWDRSKPNWELLTHLNPLANDLDKLGEDLFSLISFKKISKRHYDHTNGRMTKKYSVKSKDVIISSGLHTLFVPSFNELFDVKVHVSIEKNLRYALKINRDTKKRGKSFNSVISSLKKREKDGVNYIVSQKKNADLTFEISTTQKIDYYNQEIIDPKKFTLKIESRGLHNYRNLHKVLVGLLGLNCSMKVSAEDRVLFETDCLVSSEQIKLGANILINDLSYFIDDNPRWQEGSLGIIQLFILNQLENNRKFKSIKT